MALTPAPSSSSRDEDPPATPSPARPGSAGPAGSPRLRRRRIIAVAVAALAVIASVGGLLISTSIESPARLSGPVA